MDAAKQKEFIRQLFNTVAGEYGKNPLLQQPHLDEVNALAAVNGV